MRYSAVIDTNVLVSALLSPKNDSATVQVIEKVLKKEITILYSDEILNEYTDVLNRKKFN
ncbi:MAG: putative toxin-antitoxin system toxin component, PIN family [Selenomonadaceae bacterium]|nr:putative toxin-antitoxin system toxin component, PIN family [Selenomonadaceae bacterium]